MATQASPYPEHAWHSATVVTFAGQSDTHIETGEDYPTRTLASIFDAHPTNALKSKSAAIIPSSYNDFDARAHKRQKEAGRYVTLAGDIDGGNHDIEAVAAAVSEFAAGCAWLIYSSPHARADDRRWRVIIPLDAPAPFLDWNDAQWAFFNFMDDRGIAMDGALARAAQPVYLPNVPAIHAKTGTRLRGEDGEPLFYISRSTGLDAPALRLDEGHLAIGIDAIRKRRAESDAEREQVRIAAERKRAQRTINPSADIISDFNAGTSVETMLELCGFEQSPRHGEDWRSPHQTGETYATRVMGEKWVSLSGSDTAAGMGEKCASGCYGDAYDLYVHFKHGGDHKAAFRALHAERRAASGSSVVYGVFADPPEIEGDPGWQEMPEGPFGPMDEIEAEDIGGSSAEVESDALGFRITEWSTDRYAGHAPDIRWLCEGSIPLGVPALFAAMGGVGKSFMALDMALEIASEVIAGNGTRRILGGPIREHGSVVVLGAEDAKDSVHRRMAAIDTGGRREAALGKLFVVPLPDVGGPMTLIAGQSGEFMQTAKLDALIAQLNQIPDLKLIVLDPLQAFVASNITSDPAAGQFMWSAFARICALTGATVIACHHMRKEGASTINTADQAREAIRGSTALIDGARATYALWAASEDDTKRVCQEMGVPHQPKRVVHGAVVKSNDEHDWDVHTYVRNDSGLLSDAYEAGKRAAQKVTCMTEMQCLDFLKHIESRWRSGRPFSAMANTQDRYAVAFMQREYGVTKHVAKTQLDDWFHAEMVASEMIDKKSKLVGLKVAKWPE